MASFDSYIRHIFAFQGFHAIFFKHFPAGVRQWMPGHGGVLQKKRMLDICNKKPGDIPGMIRVMAGMVHFCTKATGIFRRKAAPRTR
ncbi:MAG: hypothetical protein ACQGQP_06915, partial [Desulfovibrio sp.]